MMDFMYPLASVVLDFLCVLFCIRLMITKHGPVWLIPMLLSFMLFFGSVFCLLASTYGDAGQTVAKAASYAALFLFSVSVIWLITIIAFASKTRSDSFNAESKKARNEAEYIRKRTERKYRIRTEGEIASNRSIGKVSGAAGSPGAEPQGKGRRRAVPVATVRVKRTSFPDKN